MMLQTMQEYILHPHHPERSENLKDAAMVLPTNKPWLFFYDDGIMSIMTRPYENRLMEWNGNNLTSVVDFIVEPSPTSWQIQEIGKDRMKATEYIDRVVFHNSRRWFSCISGWMARSGIYSGIRPAPILKLSDT